MKSTKEESVMKIVHLKVNNGSKKYGNDIAAIRIKLAMKF